MVSSKNKNNFFHNSAQLGDFLIFYPNREEFLTLKHEIWISRQYFFEPDYKERQTQSLIIFDAGAHIGLASFYWLHLYPWAQIYAFEPHPLTFDYLSYNIAQNHLSSNIKTFRTALVGAKHSQSQVTFHADQFANELQFNQLHQNNFTLTHSPWLMSASILPRAWNGQQTTTSLSVPAQKLSYFFNQFLSDSSSVSLLKLDIEGAEFSVLSEIKSYLPKIKRIMLEFHPTRQQQLNFLLALLQKNNFSIDIINAESHRPYTKTSSTSSELLFITAFNQSSLH